MVLLGSTTFADTLRYTGLMAGSSQSVMTQHHKTLTRMTHH